MARETSGSKQKNTATLLRPVRKVQPADRQGRIILEKQAENALKQDEIIQGIPSPGPAEHRSFAAEHILSAAFELLCQRGYAAVSMRDIAAGAGVALSQVAYHFGSKERLYLLVIDRMAGRYLKAAEDALGKEEPGARMAAMTDLFKRLLREQPQLFRLLIDFSAQALWVPSFRERLTLMFNRLSSLIEANLPLWEDGCRFKGHPPAHVARFILGALYGTSLQIALGGCTDTCLDNLNLAETLSDW